MNKIQQVSLKISQLVKLDQALLEVDVLLLIHAKRDDVLRVDGESIGDLVVASHGCAHLFDHALSETALLEVVEAGVGVFVLGFVVHQDALGELCPGLEVDFVWGESGFADAGCDYLGTVLGFFFLRLHDVAVDVGNVVEVKLIGLSDFLYFFARD